MIGADSFREAGKRRLAWRCRRGMLELDIVLQAFVSQHFDSLDMAQLQAFDAMLMLADNDFLALINGHDDAQTNVTIQVDATNILIEKIKCFRFVNEW